MRSSKSILFLPLAALAAPGCNHSERPQATSPPTPVVAEGRFDHGHPVIVRVAGRTGTLTVSSTPRGPVYSVVGRAGHTLLTAGTLDDLRRVDPQLYRQVRTGLASNGPNALSPDADTDDPLDYLLLAR